MWPAAGLRTPSARAQDGQFRNGARLRLGAVRHIRNRVGAEVGVTHYPGTEPFGRGRRGGCRPALQVQRGGDAETDGVRLRLLPDVAQAQGGERPSLVASAIPTFTTKWLGGQTYNLGAVPAAARIKEFLSDLSISPHPVRRIGRA